MLVVLCCLVVLGSATGCSAAEPEPVEPPPAPTAIASVPADGVLLSSLGYSFAPGDFSVPSGSVVTERVDQENTVVAVFTAPSGLDVAAYLRRNVPLQGWTITADANNSLLFERGEEHGAFTVTGAHAALALRWDARS